MFERYADFDPAMSFDWTGTDGSRWDLMRGELVRLKTTGVRGITMPDVEYQVTMTALVDGQRTNGYKLKPRQVFLPLGFRVNDVAGDQRRFWRSMTPGKFGCLVVGDGLGGTRKIGLKFGDDGQRVLRLDPNVISADPFGLTMTADDPWWYGETVTHEFEIPAAPLSMFGQAPGDAPLRITSSYINRFAVFGNPGDAPASPIWTVTAGVGGLDGFELHIGDRVISCALAMVEGDTMTIDTDPRVLSATLAGPSVVGSDDGDRTGDLVRIEFAKIEPLGQALARVVLFGEGSVHASITPRYFMGI